MTDPICLVTDCESGVKVRGLCRQHYGQWHGAPHRQDYEPLKIQPRVQRLCSLDGCDRLYASNGFCTKHDAHNRKYGTPHRRERACSECGNVSTRKDFNNELGLYCSAACKQARRYRRVAEARDKRRAETLARLATADPIKCGGCKSLRPALEYVGVYGGQTKRCSICRNKALAYRADDEIRDLQLRRAYGIGLAEYATLHAKQQGLCAICGLPESMIRFGEVQKLAVDHCHTTGLVRGLLCTRCNQGLGLFKDDAERLSEAVRYLQNFIE